MRTDDDSLTRASVADSGPGLERGVARELLRLAWPAVLTSLLQTLVFLVDRVVLARYSQDALASMQVQGPLLWSLFGVFGGLLVGTVPLVARATGQGDQARARAVARTSVFVALFVAIAIALGCGATIEPLVRALGPEAEDVRALSRDYLEIALFGFPPMFVATTTAMILAASGNTRTPFFAGLVSNGVNVVLSVLLVFGADLGSLGQIPSLGVGGAATGSVVAFTLEAALLVAALSSRSGLGLRWRAPFDRSAGLALLRISAPAVLERTIIHVGYLAYVWVITQLGPLVMATNQALITLESVCFLAADGFGVAAATVVGQSLGRQERASAKRGGSLAAVIASGALTGLGLLLWATSPWTLGAFTPAGTAPGPLASEAGRVLPLLVVAQPFMAVSVVLAQALRGAGDTRSPLLAAIAGGLMLRVALAYTLGISLGYGVVGIWWASLVDWIFRAVLLGVIFARGRWSEIRL